METTSISAITTPTTPIEAISTVSPVEEQPTQNIERIYERWGRGGIGLILSGDVGISFTTLESVGDPVIPPDADFSGPHFNEFATMGRAGKAHGSLMVAQVAHPGRLCVFVDSPVSSSEGEVSNDGRGDGIYKYPKF